MRAISPGAIPSPNIWRHPEIYEIENRAVDPDRLIESAMAAIRTWDGAEFLDIGCGAGFHLPRFAASAGSVLGVEPHSWLAAQAGRRCEGLPNVTVKQGTAQSLPAPDASVDVAHARWAYFFGPSCEPGLTELGRVVRRGGTAFVIDIDAARAAFGRWFRRSVPSYDPDSVETFWARQGWHRRELDLRMAFETRRDLEAVLRIEFPDEVAEWAIAESHGTELAYPNVLRWRHY